MKLGGLTLQPCGNRTSLIASQGELCLFRYAPAGSMEPHTAFVMDNRRIRGYNTVADPAVLVFVGM